MPFVDIWPLHRHNPLVHTRPGRIALACPLSVGIAGASLLPAEHVHRTSDHDDHPALIHRHKAPHMTHPEVSATLDHDEDAPQWLDSPYVGVRSATFAPTLGILVNETPSATARDANTRRGVPVAHAPPIHDPPLTTSGLRAPPASLL